MKTYNPTTSGVISYIESLEDHSAEFYQKLADRFSEYSSLFAGFVRESKLNKVMIIRTYRETITDALETGYSFEDLNLEDVLPKDIWNEKQDLAKAVEGSLDLERAVSVLYDDLANMSKDHLSTVTVAFEKVGLKRKARVPILETLNKRI